MSADRLDGALARPPAAVLFDLDGTLIDSVTSMADALVETLAARGRAVTVEAIVAAFGPPFEEVIASVAGVSLEEAADIAAAYGPVYYGRYAHLALPLPGADALIERLASVEVSLALVTSRREDNAHSMLAHRGWTERFPVVVGHDTAAAAKPHPAPALHALAALEVEARAAAFVGDTAEDMACARDAGVATIVGLTHLRSEGELRAAGATHVATDLAAVGSHLGVPIARSGAQS
ncbi:MAG: HAD family hydrolase [Chloroflexi bacterium]|nr:HAD family hydrolase [Chloroflexota bacterium]